MCYAVDGCIDDIVLAPLEESRMPLVLFSTRVFRLLSAALLSLFCARIAARYGPLYGQEDDID